MPYQQHPRFVPPPPETVIYRYMTLGKLLRTVHSRRLWFTNACLMEKHEGRLGAGDKEPQEWLAAFGEEFPALLHLSCWAEGPHESHAMWALYAGDGEGVCIRSTVARFIEAVAPEPGEVLIGRVRYVDHASLTSPLLDGNILSPWLCKRAVLAAEREVRAAIVQPTTDGLAVPVATTLATLMESAIVYPGAKPWFRDVVEDLLRRSELLTPVVHSAIDEAPPRKRTRAELEPIFEQRRKEAIEATARTRQASSTGQVRAEPTERGGS